MQDAQGPEALRHEGTQHRKTIRYRMYYVKCIIYKLLG